ncbi:unnamed protein product [Clonostachys rosea]|uniref:Uncharacterized protein n=1 Tax=Bionectria ochroleuca TaxID=29856 RepID=A0ABY6V1I1_BIOOC|nr:unnamed protein product [Clonostachys rosea]
MASEYTYKTKRAGFEARPCARPAKIKTGKHHHFPPAYWDDLSTLWVTPRALRELNRRNKANPPPEQKTTGVLHQNIAGFARHGGPDLTDIRGYAHRLRANGRAKETNDRPNLNSSSMTESTESRESWPPSPFDFNFEQHMVNHNLTDYDTGPRPNNLGDIGPLLYHWGRQRAALREFSEHDMKNFNDAHDPLRWEGDVMRAILPAIAGDRQYLTARNVLFDNMDLITSARQTLRPKPIFYDGACPGELHPSVKSSLSGLIVPSKAKRLPVAPNFFFEASPLSHGLGVAIGKITLDGAHGARAMHALQNYGRKEPMYDGNAYTFTFGYNARNATLKLYAHHVTAPATPGGRPGYRMTKIRRYRMRRRPECKNMNRETFCEAQVTFRRIRDFAKAQRDRFINEANARASDVTATGSD